MSEFVAQRLKAIHTKGLVDMDPSKSLKVKWLTKLYLRSLELLFRQATIYLEKKHYLNAYILFLKYTEYPLLIQSCRHEARFTSRI